MTTVDVLYLGGAMTSLTPAANDRLVAVYPPVTDMPTRSRTWL